MINEQHLITPSDELVKQWWTEETYDVNTMYVSRPAFGVELLNLATKAAQWGADQELDACCEWTTVWISASEASQLRAARRPKPASLNSIALQMLGTIERDGHYIPELTNTIRRALEEKRND